MTIYYRSEVIRLKYGRYINRVYWRNGKIKKYAEECALLDAALPPLDAHGRASITMPGVGEILSYLYPTGHRQVVYYLYEK